MERHLGMHGGSRKLRLDNGYKHLRPRISAGPYLKKPGNTSTTNTRIGRRSSMRTTRPRSRAQRYSNVAGNIARKDTVQKHAAITSTGRWMRHTSSISEHKGKIASRSERCTVPSCWRILPRHICKTGGAGCQSSTYHLPMGKASIAIVGRLSLFDSACV